MIKESLTLESLKKFFKVRNEKGELDWKEVLATTIQTIFILGTILFLYLIGLI